jgi:hypothetical protein
LRKINMKNGNITCQAAVTCQLDPHMLDLEKKNAGEASWWISTHSLAEKK